LDPVKTTSSNRKIFFLCFFFAFSPVWAQDVFRHPLVPQVMATHNTVSASLAENPRRCFMLQSGPDGRTSVLSAQDNETFTQMADVMNLVFSGQSQGLLGNFEACFLGSVSNWTIGLLPQDSVVASFIMQITMSGDSAIKSIRIIRTKRRYHYIYTVKPQLSDRALST